jgi:hypothetical protein
MKSVLLKVQEIEQLFSGEAERERSFVKILEHGRAKL